MKLSLLILSLLVTLSSTKAHAVAATCDLQKLEDEAEVAKKLMTKQLEAAIAKDERGGVDMTPYLLKVDALRACQKIMTPKTVDRCAGYAIWANKALSSKFSLQRYFEVYQGRSGSCLQNFITFQFVIRNEYDLQILYYEDGSYVMTNVIPGKSAGGINTGRTYLFVDGEVKGAASAYIIDFPEPLDSYDMSLFWGLTVPMKDSNAKLERTISGNNISFQWSNGAYVTINSLTEQIIDSNFLAPISYKPVCATDQDVAPNGRTRLFPRVELLSGANRYVGSTYLNQ